MRLVAIFPIAVLAGFILSLVLAVVGSKLSFKNSWVISLVPLSIFVYFASFLGQISAGEVFSFTYTWVPSLGVDLGFRLDGLALLFLLLITGIGSLVFFYTTYYLKGHLKLGRFYAYLSAFMGAMIGLVLSDNIFSLFIFWELTSISSFFLIGFNNEEEASRKSALTALAITGFGGLALLAFAVYANYLTGSTSIHDMLMTSEAFDGGLTGMLLLLFILTAAFTKSAQFPFHFWLPGAMKAPTPVSTYLHSATMVKAGVYLLLRFTPHFEHNDWWGPILITFGGVTMLYAAFHTLFRTDMKGVLAYSTISALGILVFLIGLGNEKALTAALVFIIVHALYKAALFLITGIVDHQTGTRDLSKLSGLRNYMWPVAIAGFIAAVSSAGIPPLVGFVGKDLIYEGTQSSGLFTLTLVAVITNILLGFAGFAVGLKPFSGKENPEIKDVKKPSFILWLPPVLLSFLSLLFGLFPFIIGDSIVDASLMSIGVSSGAHLKLWHGFNFILLLSFVTIIGVLCIYFLWRIKTEKERFIQRFEGFSPQSILSNISVLFEKLAYFWTKTAQNGHLRNYVLIIVLALIVALGYHVFDSPSTHMGNAELTPLSWSEVSIVSIMFVSILFTVFSKSRLAAIAGLGVVGYAMCFVFVFFSAPDLAMTQFTIDTLTVILFVLVLYRLPPYLNLSNTPLRIRDGLIALGFGGLITLITLEVMNEEPVRSATAFYAENAYVMAKGKNVVNVILVDFRGLDTMIEVIVLSIAAIGVFGLIKLRLKKNEN
jgi:multicomponent Na+:H+ antiporter subunit A